MRTGTGIAGATLLYGPQAGEPDLVLTMQLLLDEMRGDGRRIGGVKLTATTLRVRADPFDLVLTLASAPLPRKSRSKRRAAGRSPAWADSSCATARSR